MSEKIKAITPLLSGDTVQNITKMLLQGHLRSSMSMPIEPLHTMLTKYSYIRPTQDLHSYSFTKKVDRRNLDDTRNAK